MRRLIARKLLFSGLSLFVMLLLTFVLMKSIPGDPFQQEQALPKEIYEALRDHYGLNDTLLTQFKRYLGQFLSLDFGPSLVYKGRSVSDIIYSGLPASAILGLEALIFAVPIGLILGIAAANYQDRWQDKCVLLFAIIGVSLPSFIIATLLQYVLAIQLHLLPVARWGTFAQTIMPALALAALPMAFIARMTRSKMIAEMRQPYVMTARAQGYSEAQIIYSKVLRNILPPILCYLGPLIASIMTGSFIVERIFAVPGLGYWFVTSVLNRDYPLIMGITIFYCSFVLLASFVVDIACYWLDPRLAQKSNNRGDVV